MERKEIGEQKKIRRSLFCGSVLTVVLTMFFLWILNSNGSRQLQNMLGLCILILGMSAALSLAFFFAKGPVFNIRGQIESGNIMAMLIAILVVIQLAFAFAAYFQREQYLRFVLYDEHIEESLIQSELAGTVTGLLTTLVISVFFSVEIVWLMIKLTTEKRQGENRIKPAALSYVRQLAFLFYFASRLSSAFIPIMAKSFGETFLGMSESGAAGLPQSAETLLTCVAIFATTELLTRKGWKLPFGVGILLVALGTFLSALSPTLLAFIAARAVVGLGYGFCWMTLRNLALFGKDDGEQAWGFSMLNAGLYAGMNCGSSLGAILAEQFGYRSVFFMAAALTLLCSFAIIRMENAVLRKREEEPEEADGQTLERERFGLRETLQAVSFSVLMIAPSCFAASYLSYFLPLYFESIGRGVSDVGRAQLLYGVVIVYIGPKLSEFLIGKDKKLLLSNYGYNLLFSAGFLVLGCLGGTKGAFFAALCLAVADSFGFSVQNNYFLALPSVRRMGASRSLSYLSFLKKMSEMLGPTVFALALILGYEPGVRFLGILFLAAAALFYVLQLLDQKSRRYGSRRIRENVK
ncbi:MAG: MFS transporter [Lachnospiraceae bacterium]|nr:MFS transporter [Lachnospiraceae bacterium]